MKGPKVTFQKKRKYKGIVGLRSLFVTVWDKIKSLLWDIVSNAHIKITFELAFNDERNINLHLVTLF